MKKRVIATMLSLAMIVTAIPSALPVYAAEELGDVQVMTAEPEQDLIVPEETQDGDELSSVEETQNVAEGTAQDPEITIEDSAVVPQAEAFAATSEVAQSDVPERSAVRDLSALADIPMPVTTASADITKISVVVTGDSAGDTFSAGTFTTTEASLTQEAENTKISFDPAKAGEDQKLPKVAVTYTKTETAEGTEAPKETTVTLREGQDLDYTVTGANLRNAAKASDANAPSLTIRFYGEYENLGDIIIKFAIEPASLADAVIGYELDGVKNAAAVEYDGKEHVPTIVSVTLGGKQIPLTEGVDYTVNSIADKKNANDSISFNITGQGNYTGSPVKAVIYKIEKTAAEKGIELADSDTLVFDNVEGKLSSADIEARIAAGVINKLDAADVLTNGESYEIVCYKGAETLAGSKEVAVTDAEKMAAGVHKYEIKMTEACKNFKKDSVVAGYYELRNERSLEEVVAKQKTAIDTKVLAVNTYKGEDLKADIIAAITSGLESYVSAANPENKGKFTVTCEASQVVDCGKYAFKVTGAKASPWDGQTVEVAAEVTPKEIAASATALKDEFKLEVTQKYYADGSADAPVFKFTENGKEMKSTDYSCDLGYDESLRNVVTTAKITGTGNYKTTVDGKAIVVAWTIDPAVSKVIDLSDKTIQAEVTAKFDYHPEELTLKAEDITVTQTIPGRTEPYRIDPSKYYISVTDYGTDKEKGQSKKAGLHHVTIEAKQNTGYIGKIENIEFTVEGIDINTHYGLDTSKLDELQIEFGSEVSCPTPTVVAKGTDKLLNTDNYKLSYSYIKDGKKTYIVNPNAVDEKETYLFTVEDKITFPVLGTYTIEIIPDPEKFEMYMGTLTCELKILAKSIANKEKFTTTCDTEIIWPGRAVTVDDLKEIAVFEAGEALKKGTDYTVAITDGDKTGTATVTITGIGNYRESVTKQLKINKKSFEEATVAYAKAPIPYCSDLEQAVDAKAVTVTIDGKAVDPSEYSVSFTYADSPINSKVTITAKAAEAGHYSDSANIVVAAATGADISKAPFVLEGFEDILYSNGRDAVEQKKLVLKDTTLGIELKADVDYKVTYTNNKPAAGSGAILIATVTLTGKGDAAASAGYYGTITKNFTITLPALKEVTVVAGQDLAYTGAPILPKVTVKDTNGNVVLEEAYKVSGKENQDAGTATVVVTAVEGKGYTGFAETTFTITKAKNTVEASVSPEEIKIGETAKISASAKGDASFTYTSSDEEVATVDEEGMVTGKAAGTAEITVSAAATNNYEAAEEKVTIIVAKKENRVSVTAAPSGMKVNESAKVTAKAEGGAKLTYTSSDERVAAVSQEGVVTAKAEGKAVITVNAAETDEYTAASTTFTVTVTKPQVVTKPPVKTDNTIKASNVKKFYSAKKRSFKLKVSVEHKVPLSYKSNKAAVRVNSAGKITVKAGFVGEAKITITAAETELYKTAKKTIRVVVRPSKTWMWRASSSDGVIKLRWKKNPIATGYQIQYSQDKSYGKSKIITVKGADSVEKKLEKGKTYYLRIRVYKTASRKRFYSKWSKGQTITIE